MAVKSKPSMVLAWKQAGVGEMALDATPIALGDLVLGEGGEEAGGRPAFLVGAFGKGCPPLFDGRQPQVGEDEVEAGGVEGLGHAASPRSLLSSAS